MGEILFLALRSVRGRRRSPIVRVAGVGFCRARLQEKPSAVFRANFISRETHRSSRALATMTHVPR